MPPTSLAIHSPNSISPARHSPQRPMPTRTQQHRQLNNVPGIINLPLSRVDSSSSSNSSSTTRHHYYRGVPVDKLVHESLGEKPVPTLEQHSMETNGEPKKRRRQKKQLVVSDPASGTATDGFERSAGEMEPATTGTVDENGVDQSTPTKSRRRRGRATRQTSPPIPESLLGPAPVEEGFTSTTPPQADQFSCHSHSQSVPPELPLERKGSSKYRHHSSGDEWDMPTLGGGGTGGRGRTIQQKNEPKENLSWQQELLKATNPTTTTTRHHHSKVGADSSPKPSSSTRSTAVTSFNHPPRQTRHSAPAPRNLQPTQKHAPPPPRRPVLHPSLSDTTPSLNWQQEMLLQTDHLQTSALLTNDRQQQPQQTSDRRIHSSSPTKPSSSSTTNFSTGDPSKDVSSLLTPARQRQHRIKDSITFGLTDLEISDVHHQELEPNHYQSSSISRHNSLGQRNSRITTTPRRHSPPTSVEVITPTKDNLGPRYAGPTFHNSPAPSSLPVPSFVLRRQT